MGRFDLFLCRGRLFFKGLTLLLAALLFAPALPGCWSYRSLNEIAIVTGLAVDHSPDETQKYKLTLEMIDMNVSVKDNETKALLVEGEGKTIGGALDAAQRKLSRKLFYGNMQLLVLDHNLAEREGIRELLDSFFHNIEIRETLSVVLSGEETAAAILKPPKDKSGIVSKELKMKLETEKRTSAYIDVDLNEAEDVLYREDLRLVLPVFRMTGKEDEAEPAFQAMGLFEGDKLSRQLHGEDLRPYLFAVDAVRGGPLIFPMAQGTQPNVTLTVTKSQTTRSFRFEDGRLTLTLSVKAAATLSDGGPAEKDAAHIEALGQRAATVLRQDIERVIRAQQTGRGLDVFGFEALIRRQNLPLWETMRNNWRQAFMTADLDVRAEVTVTGTGLLR